MYVCMYVCMWLSLEPERLDGFIFSIYEFTHHMLLTGEYEHFSSKNRAL
jgi:hypothetical protein